LGLQKLTAYLKNKYATNTLWILVGRAFEMLLTMVVGILVARYMTESEYGYYNYALSIATIFAVLSNLGLANIVTKYIVNQEADESEVLGSALLLKLIGGVFSVAAAMLFAVLLGNSKTSLLYVLIACVPILIKSLDVISFYFDAKVLSKYNVMAKTMGIVASNLLKLLVVILHWNIMWIYFSLLFDATIFVSLLYVHFQRKGKTAIWKWSKNKIVVKSLFKESWPLMFTGIIYVFYLKIDQVMIKDLLNASELGHYSAAVKLSSTWYTIPWLITGSLFPALLNALKKNVALFNERFSLLCQGLYLLAIIAIIPISFLADWLIEFLFSGKYNQAGLILQIHVWSSVFIFIGYAGSKWLIAKNLQRIALINMCIGAVLNVALNYWLIPIMGIAGAAYVTLVTQALTFIVMPVFFAASRELFFLQIQAFFKAITIVYPVKKVLKILKERS
jgi:O-antigen/teichoic acid export membrane protein